MERILFLVPGRIKRDEMTIRDLGLLSAQGRKIWHGMEWKAKFELNGTRKGRCIWEVYMQGQVQTSKRQGGDGDTYKGKKKERKSALLYFLIRSSCSCNFSMLSILGAEGRYVGMDGLAVSCNV